MYINENFEAAGNEFKPASFYEANEKLAIKPSKEELFETQEFCEQVEELPETDEKFSFNLRAESLCCPFCHSENEPEAIVCHSCQTILTLSDLEMLLAHTKADREILRQAVERMEAEKSASEFSCEELKTIALGQINLKNLRRGFSYLKQASQANRNDIILSSQVNALAVWLAEIEQQQNIHDSMPKGRTIMVVDDSETVRNLISARLEKSGHNVLCAVDGVDALEKINETVPDLILLDASMPRMDGFQVCKIIRGNNLTKDVPVIMISEKDGFFDKVRGHLAGITGYITKPFGPERLMKTVDTYIF
jgi:twitching motility two-component system response regulator PilG